MGSRIKLFACALLTITSLVFIGCGSSFHTNPNLNQWAWVSGANTVNQSGTYGTQGTGASSSVPGARSSAVTWTDRAGNFWLFGGAGYDSAGTLGQLNDLWVYNGRQWIWVSGANTVNQKGTYGTQGTASSSNVPGARSNAISWTDRAGNFWLFGGIGYDSAGNQGQLNDLWLLNRSNQWVWVSGSNLANQSGTYGTQGTGASSNVPGARSSSVSWIDGANNLWLSGGTGYDSAGTLAQLNDLWVFNRNNSQWVWIGGSNLVNQSGTYGTQGSSASSNVPGARSNAISWTDGGGNFWLFGGVGYDSAGTLGQLNDLWVLNLKNQWIWINGANTVNQKGTYGTQGTAASANVPGARSNSINWIDWAGNLWLYGGSGLDSAGTSGQLNDLWVLNRNNQWVWVSGANIVNQKGTYGTQGTAASGNVPGARSNAASWMDGGGNLWLYGGAGLDSAGTQGQLNDLWVFQP